jgi:hypothetical protein
MSLPLTRKMARRLNNGPDTEMLRPSHRLGTIFYLATRCLYLATSTGITEASRSSRKIPQTHTPTKRPWLATVVQWTNEYRVGKATR